MTISIRVMSAGQGYRYLLKSVVAGDRDRDAASALTGYYTDAGTPPGIWLGLVCGLMLAAVALFSRLLVRLRRAEA